MTNVPFHLVVREYFNGALFCLELYLLAILTYALWRSWRRAESFRTWRKAANIAALIGLAVFVFGDTMRAGWVWGLLKSFNDGGNQSSWYKWFAGQWEFSLVAVLLACVGLLCAVRMISPAGGLVVRQRKIGWADIHAAAAFTITAVVLILSSFVFLG